MKQKQKQRKTTRLPNYDYSDNGEYFVTICAKDFKEVLGEVKDGEIVLNKYGRIVEQQLLWLAKQYDYIEIDSYVVMPNHVHAVVIYVGTARELSGNRAGLDPPLQKTKPLSELIGAFKTTSSKKIHQLDFRTFQWQRSFYDHIIETDEELAKIQDYILLNPANWDNDKNNPENTKNF